MSEDKEYKPKSQSVSTGKLNIYEASDYRNSIRIESYTISHVIKINEETNQTNLKLEWTTMCVLRHVLNTWYDVEVKNRGKVE